MNIFKKLAELPSVKNLRPLPAKMPQSAADTVKKHGYMSAVKNMTPAQQVNFVSRLRREVEQAKKQQASAKPTPWSERGLNKSVSEKSRLIQQRQRQLKQQTAPKTFESQFPKVPQGAPRAVFGGRRG